MIATMDNVQGPLTGQAARVAADYSQRAAALRDKGLYALAAAEELLDGHPEFAYGLVWKAVGIHRRAEELSR